MALLVRTIPLANARGQIRNGVDVRYFKRFGLPALLPIAHLCACGLAAAIPDVFWNWFWIMLLDLPCTYVLDKAGKLLHTRLISAWGLTVFGTLWWLCIGFVLSAAYERFARRFKTGAAA